MQTRQGAGTAWQETAQGKAPPDVDRLMLELRMAEQTFSSGAEGKARSKFYGCLVLLIALVVLAVYATR